MDRESFLSRIRDAARAGLPYRVHQKTVAPDTGYVGAQGDLCERVAEEVTLVGGKAQRVKDVAEARAFVKQLLAEYRVTSAVCWEHDLLDRVGVSELLAERGAARLDYELLSQLSHEEARAKQLAAEICISSCDYALAETGTLAVCSRPGQERLASLIAPAHIALVERSQILPDLFDLFARLQMSVPDKLPSNVALITGPSKSGDIELQLTTGVHGPGKWHVVVIG